MNEPKWTGGVHRALRSEADELTRFLRESLVELWQTKQIATETIPRLLHGMEPRLGKSDYKPVLHDRRMRSACGGERFCPGLVAVTVFSHVMDEVLPRIASAVVLGKAGACWLFLYLLFFRRLSRRKRQMRWLLEQATAKDALMTHAMPSRIAERTTTQ